MEHSFTHFPVLVCYARGHTRYQPNLLFCLGSSRSEELGDMFLDDERALKGLDDILF